MTEALKKTLKAYESTVECLEIELANQLNSISMLNKIIDGLTDVIRQQTATIKVYEDCTKLHH